LQSTSSGRGAAWYWVVSGSGLQGLAKHWLSKNGSGRRKSAKRIIFIYREKNFLTLNFSCLSVYISISCLFRWMTAPPPLLHHVFILYFISTYPTINICLCYRRPVPNIPPRIPDRPYSGRLNWASPTQQWHTRQQLVLYKMQQFETTSGKISS